MTTGLLDTHDTDLLRTALAEYTVAATAEVGGGNPDRVQTLVALFLRGHDVDEAAARRALAPLPFERAVGAGLVRAEAGSVRAQLQIRPYAPAATSGPPTPWWVVSDFGSDVRPAPPPADHVLGVGAASVTLAQTTPRLPVGRAADIGTGCGVQALHLGLHAAEVVATDVSPRALTFAATTAALSGQEWDLRCGSFLEPLAGERFDLVVSNPPFVVSSGVAEFDYRDSGLAGDAVCETLVRGLPNLLAEGGTAQILANWVSKSGVPWDERVAGWVAGSGCDAWVWQGQVTEPGEYAAMWLRDAREQPGTRRWIERYDAWLAWFAAADVEAVGLGLITLWRTDSSEPVIVLEDIRQPVEQPAWPSIAAWQPRQRWLAERSDADLLAADVRPAAGLVQEREEVIGSAGWEVAVTRLRQAHGMRWSADVDDAVCALVAGCASGVPLSVPVRVLAEALARPFDEVTAAILPLVRKLIGRGFLEPAELSG